LLLTISPLINGESLDLNFGLVEVLLFKMLQLDAASPQLAHLSQSLLQLCSDHPKLLSLCIRCIPASIIPFDVNRKPDVKGDAIVVTMTPSPGSAKEFCVKIFDDILAPDCVWTEDCRKELLHNILQRTVELPSMASSVSDDTVIRPVICQSDSQFVSSAQNKYTLVHGIYLELFVLQSKWVCRDSKSLLEEIFVQLSKVYKDSDSPKSPAKSHQKQ
jgi:hypothetical protein